MLGTDLIRDFYTMALHGRRTRDSVGVVYSRFDGEELFGRPRLSRR